MDKKNINLLHGLFFAIFTIILVYCGEQIRNAPTGIPSLYIRISSIFSTIGNVSLLISFWPARLSNYYKKHANELRKTIDNLYLFDGNNLNNLNIEAAKKIEVSAMWYGNNLTFQNIYDECNKILLRIAMISAILSVVFFTIGIYLYE